MDSPDWINPTGSPRTRLARRFRSNGVEVTECGTECRRIDTEAVVRETRRSLVRVHPLRWAVVVACGTLAFAVGGVSSLVGQPNPKITSVWPEWVQRGTTCVLTVEGENLTPIKSFVFSGDSGMSAATAMASGQGAKLEASRGGIVPADGDEKLLRISVTVASDAVLGPRELRIVTPDGVSTPVTVNVGFIPENTDRRPNHSTNESTLVELPVAINGRIGEPAVTDYYRFKARQGERLIFDVNAFRSGSPLDSSLALLGSNGKELLRSEDVNGLDSLIDFVVPVDGEYVLQVRDFRYQGGKDFKYRIVAGGLPYLDSVFPSGGQRGQPIEVTLRGRNLDGLSKMKMRVEPDAPLGQQEIRAHTARGYSNPILFAIGELPELMEAEPNNTATNANTVKVPVTINGRIGSAKDVDQFVFTADKGQALIFEVFASRSGSPLDAVLTLTDKSGKVIQENDDATGADARIEQTFAEAGEYLLKIRDLLNRGGEEFAYRLMVRAPRADFSATFSPDTPRINRGGHAIVSVDVQRQGGFGGPVEVRIENLPEGVTAGPLIVPPDSGVSPLIVLHAQGTAPLGHHAIKLVSTAVVDGERVSRPGKPQADGRVVREAFLMVLDEPAFTLEPVTVSARMEQNQAATVECLVWRRVGFTNEIQISAEGFSSGKEPLTKNVDVESVTMKGVEARASLKLKAKTDSETGTRMIVFKGEAKVDGHNVTQFSRAIPLTIDSIPFTLVNSLPRLAVTAAPPERRSAASEAEFSIKASRRGWFAEDIALSVEGLPEGISINATNIMRGVGEAGFKLVATDKSPVGKEISLTVVGTADANGRSYQFRAAPIKISVNAPEEAVVPAAVTSAAK